MQDVTVDHNGRHAADMSFAAWKHYEDRIAFVKESFTRTTSLLLGFAVALLAWGAQHAIDWSVGTTRPFNVPLLFIVAVGGLGLTVFAWHITNDAAIHIASNMERANRAAGLVPILSRVTGRERDNDGPESSPSVRPESVHICRQARQIIVAFGLVFAISTLVALVQFCRYCLP